MTLEEKHRKAQLVLRAATLKQLLRLWPAFNLKDISGTWDAFEAALVLLMKARGTTSGALARSYLREYDGGDLPALAKLDTDTAVAGLRIVGPLNAAKQLSLGRPEADVRKATLVNVSGEVTRHVFNMGRATMLSGLAMPFRPDRWRRVTDADPCVWCSSQASISYPTATGFRSHKHCACFPAPA